MTELQISPSIERLLSRVAQGSNALPPLRATKAFDPSLTSDIESFAKQSSSASTSSSQSSVRAALYLLNDDIERAHEIAQSDEGNMSSNLCHAILHRREGDFWNAKWWYRQIEHPLIEQVYGGTREAQAFVDAIEAITSTTSKRSGGSSTPCAATNLDKLKRKQADELEMLVKFVLRQASTNANA